MQQPEQACLPAPASQRRCGRSQPEVGLPECAGRSRKRCRNRPVTQSRGQSFWPTTTVTERRPTQRPTLPPIKLRVPASYLPSDQRDEVFEIWRQCGYISLCVYRIIHFPVCASKDG